MLPSSVDRVPQSTSDDINLRIQAETLSNIEFYGRMGTGAIGARLKELDEEWDIERAIEANAATLALTGVALGAFADRRFLILPGLVAAFLLQHALQGWCPPVPILRRMGYRTVQEIEEERYALKAIRGDFQNMNHIDDQIDRAVVAYETVRHG